MLSLVGVQVAETIVAQVEQVVVLVYLTQDAPLRQQVDVAYAVGRHVTAVAHLWLKGLKVIAVVAAQAVPRGKPHKALLVLQQLSDMCRRHAVGLVVFRHVTHRLCPQRHCCQPAHDGCHLPLHLSVSLVFIDDHSQYHQQCHRCNMHPVHTSFRFVLAFCLQRYNFFLYFICLFEKNPFL